MLSKKLIWCLVIFLSAAAFVSGGGRSKPPYTEEQRQAEYIKRGHTWPPKIYPDSEGWKHILNQRFAQIRALENTQMKWDGFIQTLSAALMKSEYQQNTMNQEVIDCVRSPTFFRS
jgi:hypothetical protein